MLKRFLCIGINFLLLSNLISCSSTIKNMAVGTTADILYDASFAVETQSNFENVKAALPANLIMMEGLLYIQPDNTKILAAVTKAHAANGYAIYDTLYLDDYYAEKDESVYKQKALYNYSKAWRFGLRFLELHGITYQNLIVAMRSDNGIFELLDGKLKNNLQNREAIFYMAQSLGSMINLQKDKLSLVAIVSIPKSMFDWVCAKDPKMGYGACGIFNAAFEAGRPRMLGGNPELGKRLFLQAIAENPDNFLIRAAYIQFYLIPMQDEDGYKEQRFYLEKSLREHNEEIIWKPGEKTKAVFAKKELRFYQILGLKRFETIKKYEKEIF